MYQNYTGKNSQLPNMGNSAPSPQQQPGQQNQVGRLESPYNPALLNPGIQSSRSSYASMIIPSQTTSKPPTGFGKLQSMGRVIREEPEPVIRVKEAPTSQALNVPNTLSFKGSGADRPKMSSSVIFPKSEDSGLSFQPSNTQGFGTTRLDGLLSRGKNVEVHEEEQETPEDRRKRKIGSIKEEHNKINKKMENFSFRKPEDNHSGKQYFQLPTRKVSAIQPSSQTHLQAFKNYSKSNKYFPTANSSRNSVNLPQNFQSEAVEPIKHQANFLQVKQDQVLLQHSVSANELKEPSFRKEEPGGMFKKKMNQFEFQVSNPQPAKSFLLSPKAQPSPVPSPVDSKFKAAEMIEPPKVKGMKRIDSVVQEDVKGGGGVEARELKRSDFVVGKKLGKGQFGEVMMVIHKVTGFLCAMKVMSKKQIREEKYENQVARELSIQFYLEHRNVSPLYGYFTDEENMYLLVEFATGGQLLQTLRKAHRMEEPDCSPIIREVCEGLDYVHKEQIIHRDIKPENILFNFDTVKICDFGWAVHCGLGMRQTVAGSPLYYSPEVVKQTKYDEKIDIWAIGMMTYECILGKIPFRIYSQLDLNRIVKDEIKFPEYVDVSEEGKDFILKICKKDPDERMDMRDIIRHPFITKYLKQRKVPPEVVDEFHRFLAH